MQPGRFNLLSPLEDTPLTVQSHNGEAWKPKNYDKRAHGTVPLHQALAHSYNMATVRLGMSVGLDQVANRLQDLGLKRPVEIYPSLLLGAISLTPLEVTQIYQTFASGGFHSPLRAIREVLTAEQQPLQRYPLTVKQTVPADATYLVNQVLQEVVRSGTGRALAQYISPQANLAGKTGTTDDLRDSWFAGFSGDKVAVVWVGRDDNKPAGLSGSTGALRVWGNIMQHIQPTALEILPPESIEIIWVDPVSGLRADKHCAGAIQVPYVIGFSPNEHSSCVSKSNGSVFKNLLEVIFE
jgi:penicillin-binding protein 1B